MQSAAVGIKPQANGPNIVGPNNVVTCCVRLHGTTTMLALVAYSLKPVKRLSPCKRTQHCWPTTPNNVGNCWHLVHPFAWVLRPMRTEATLLANNTQHCFAPQGCGLLRPFTWNHNNAGTCWHLLRTV